MNQYRIFYRDRKDILKQFNDFDFLQEAKEVERELHLTCSKNEYFILPLFIVGNQQESLRVKCGNERVICFCTEGSDKWGKNFIHSVTIFPGNILPLYFGFSFSVYQDTLFQTELTFISSEKRIVIMSIIGAVDKLRFLAKNLNKSKILWYNKRKRMWCKK